MKKRIFIALGTSSFFAVFGNLFLASLLGLTYTNLTQEQVIASLTFKDVPNSSKVYEATLYNDKGLKIGNYKIYGDQWRIDVAFIKMKYWASALGADAKYALDRLEGRYKNIEAQNREYKYSYHLWLISVSRYKA